jgi:hypothetical protein
VHGSAPTTNGDLTTPGHGSMRSPAEHHHVAGSTTGMPTTWRIATNQRTRTDRRSCADRRRTLA